MKRQIITQIQAVVALLLLVAACSDDATDTWQDAGNGSPLTIQVCSDGFSSSDGCPTRAADIGYTTVFQDGDRLGIVAEQQDGNKQNLCATYNGATKAWEGIYYDSKTTYLSAYFPYQEGLTNQLNNISDAGGVLSALKTLLPPSADQSSLAAYRASDLLAGTCTLHTEGGKSLKVTLSHAYSLLLLRAGTEYTTSDGFVYRLPLRDVQVNVDNAVCTPFASAEGYRLIVDKSGSPSVAWFYTLPDGKTYKVAGSASLTKGTYHLYNNVTSGGNRALAVGDFYYSDGSICPGTTSNPPGEGCIGVVYWVGDKAFQDDPLLQRDHPGCTHGLVVALQDAGQTLWSSSYEEITYNWLKNQGNTYGITTLKEENKMQGYANTKALEGYNASGRATGSNSGKTVLPIGLIQSYAGVHPAPASSSGWYFPSVKELKFMCWGQNASGGTEGKKKLDEQFRKITGASSLQSYYYWSSTERDYSRAWYVNFNSGYVGSDYSKYYSSCWVRAVLAF
ncbi:fimbrillin family protein [Phocaeicola sartorii]|uniref:fimbrillin family protein n=1 Tax=Phocaeicola sartorii TaxID=671267 RepID=UPI001F55F8BC|nr:fimbrillin family protein [Phocaeicola sartorii]